MKLLPGIHTGLPKIIRIITSIFCFAAIVAILLIGPPVASAWARVTVASDGSPSPAGSPVSNGEGKSSLIQSEKVDEAGEKIGKGIDRFSESASRRIGGWANAPVVAGITWLKLLFCLGLVFFVIILERTVQLIFRAKVKSLSPDDPAAPWLDQIIHALSRPLTLFIWVYGVYVALSPLYGHFRTAQGTNPVHAVATKATDIGVAIAVIWFMYRLIYVVDLRLKRWAAGTESTIDNVLVPIVGKTLRVFIVIIGGVIVMQNLTGVEIGPLLASLGIGGLAVALAAKDSIANFFGTITILFDKPFQIGERIVVDKYDGTVEHVGFRSTRIRTLNGLLVTIPNQILSNSSSENIGRRPYIRWLTNIGITYDTPPEKVDTAVRILREILADHEGMHPDFPPRVFFNGFNDWSLNIMVVVWYHPPAYWDYSEWLQKTCLSIMHRFREEGIDFAFPSQTVYVAGDDKRRLTLAMLKGNVPADLHED